MFIGHFAVALGAKKIVPTVSLGTLFLACQLADLIWPNLVLLGIETVEIEPGNTVMTPLDFVHYPYSHSLLATLLWSAILGGVYMSLTRSGRHVAIAVGAVVFSHWVLDFVTHRPDLPLTLSNEWRVGVGLWNSPIIGISLELLLFGLGVWLYARSTRALNRRGSIGFWALILFLLAAYAANLLGPPPPSPAAVAWTAQALWLVVAWGFWIDRHRTGAATRIAS
ncbi:MAG: hypothetical protein KJO31_10855 [Gammaproteobacteria bacterium]|nr:hypothetical protein [Gammaproteobacteria bacterium]